MPERFDCKVYGEDRPMSAATNSDGVTIVNFGIGSANAATIMDLLSARDTKGVLFLGKCGGLKKSTEIGNFHFAYCCYSWRRYERRLFSTRSSCVAFFQAAQVCVGKA